MIKKIILGGIILAVALGKIFVFINFTIKAVDYNFTPFELFLVCIIELLGYFTISYAMDLITKKENL